jgi:hypothetical protein
VVITYNCDVTYFALKMEAAGCYETLLSICETTWPYVEAGLNTSTIALQVVRGNEKGTQCLVVKLVHPVPGGYKYRDLAFHVWGSLESETVKCARESCGTQT